MGLKKTNYEAKAYGITLPEAYAVITSLQIEGNHGVAEFSVQTSRKTCFNLLPVAKDYVEFDYADRTQNPYEVAYLASKEKRTNSETGEEYKMPFWDWEDDIVTEQKEE